ncbi:hypothetical protein AL066_10565 [Pseudomonas nunensis]|nr:hypothetical protein AM274_07200 [Pseudomonas nunensis]KPN90749.1 hypothetical protein AL066_10565 [Pseudomonas nunensis]
MAPNCIVMLAVEIKGFSCEAFRVAKGAAVPIQYLVPVFKPREMHPGQKRKVHLAISGQQQWSAWPESKCAEAGFIPVINQGGRVMFGGDCTGLAL